VKGGIYLFLFSFWKWQVHCTFTPVHSAGYLILRNEFRFTQEVTRQEINIFKSLARSNVFSTKSEEQEVNLVWPNLCIFWLLFICLYRSWSLPNFVCLTNNYFKWTKCFISFIFTMERLFYNSHLYSLYIGSLLQLCSFCFTAFQHYIYSNVLRIFYL
jgi:hypothetical protein